MSYIHSAGFTSLGKSFQTSKGFSKSYTKTSPLFYTYFDFFRINGPLFLVRLANGTRPVARRAGKKIYTTTEPASQSYPALWYSLSKRTKKMESSVHILRGRVEKQTGLYIPLSLSTLLLRLLFFFLFFERRRWSQRGYPDHSVTFPSGSSS